MAKLSIFSVPRPALLDLPSGLSLIHSLDDAAIVSSPHANHKTVVRIADRGRPMGLSNRSQGYVAQPVLRFGVASKHLRCRDRNGTSPISEL
jgi:hypothetical protein